MKSIIETQQDDASFEEIIREIAFELMFKRGLVDTRKGNIISDEEMRHRIITWQDKVDIQST